MKIKTDIENLEKYKKYLKTEEAVNEFLKQKGYLKIDLPVLSPALIPESYLEVFETEFKYFQRESRLYLTPSPELFLKRLLVYGTGSNYYLGKSFRNSEPNSSLHSPEFTMLEMYRLGVDYLRLSDDVLAMLQFIATRINGKPEIRYQDRKINFSQWEKISIVQAFEKYAGISQDELFDKKKFEIKAKAKKYETNNFSYEDLFSQIYSQEIEPNLGRRGFATLIYDYPKEFAALAKLNKDGKTAQRFEFYIEGVEIGDCYTELTDWAEQEKRFIEEDKKRKEMAKIEHPIDKGFIEALKYGLPDAAGIAIGFERLAMIFADATSINQLKLININL